MSSAHLPSATRFSFSSTMKIRIRRAPESRCSSASTDQRHLRTLSPHHPGRVLRHRLSQEALYHLGGVADGSGGLDYEYNRTRPHSGKYCYGKTPMQTFLDLLLLAREKMLDSFSTPAPEPSPAQRSGGAAA